MQKLRLSWLAKGVAAAALALALVFASAHLTTAQAAPAHAATIVPVSESQALTLSLHPMPTYLAQGSCIAPLSAHTTFSSMFAPAFEPAMIVHPSMAHCLMPLHVTLPATNLFSQLYLNVAASALQK
jgi:hypothetical protein